MQVTVGVIIYYIKTHDNHRKAYISPYPLLFTVIAISLINSNEFYVWCVVFMASKYKDW